MSITYETRKVTAPTDGVSEIIRESHEHFMSENIDFQTRDGFKQILTSKPLFEEYVASLSEGFDTEEEKNYFGDLMQNFKNEVLAESTLADVDVVAPLHGPMLRKYLPKLVITEAMPTEAVALPFFKIDYHEPYFEDTNGVRHDFKEYFRNKYLNNGPTESLPRVWGAANTEWHKMEVFYDGVNPITGKTAAGSIAQWNSQPITDAGYSGGFVATGSDTDDMDVNFRILKLKLDLGNNNNNGQGTVVTLDFIIKADAVYNNIFQEVKYVVPENIAASGDITAVTAGTVFTDTLFGNFNRTTKLLKLVSQNSRLADGFNGSSAIGANAMAKIIEFQLDGKISNQWNERDEGQVGFTIRHKDIKIPHGKHLNSPFNIEYLQDLKALYNIDGTLKAVELMTEFFAHSVEYEGWKFLTDSFVNNDLASNGWFATFNVQPYASFAGRPSEWREEFKRIIDYIATRQKNTTNFPGGIFVIFGNPLDLNVIENANWTFVGAENEKSGVQVEFNVGVFKGAYNYRLVSSPNIPQGNLRMMFYPGGDDHMTYKLYTYTFNVISDNSFRSPVHSNVPNIAMIKRYQFEEFIPMQAVFQIDNNTPESMLGYAANPNLPAF